MKTTTLKSRLIDYLSICSESDRHDPESPAHALLAELRNQPAYLVSIEYVEDPDHYADHDPDNRPDFTEPTFHDDIEQACLDTLDTIRQRNSNSNPVLCSITIDLTKTRSFNHG